MSKFDFTLNSAGVKQLLKSAEVKSAVGDIAREVSSSAGDGFSVEVRNGEKRAYANVKPVTEHAQREVYNHNVLVKALGSVKK